MLTFASDAATTSASRHWLLASELPVISSQLTCLFVCFVLEKKKTSLSCSIHQKKKCFTEEKCLAKLLSPKTFTFTLLSRTISTTSPLWEGQSLLMRNLPYDTGLACDSRRFFTLLFRPPKKASAFTAQRKFTLGETNANRNFSCYFTKDYFLWTYSLP